MQREERKQRILVLGASGFIGNAIYKELHPYFNVHGTYCKQYGMFADKQVFHHFCMETDPLASLLEQLVPSVIVSAMGGDLEHQLEAHRQILEYASVNPDCSVLFISSFKVFDAKNHRPFYENDTTRAESLTGKTKIAIENLLLENLPLRTTIVRLPIVLGINSPEIFHLRQCIRHQASFEVFPNRAITATTVSKVCQQIHYIINRSLRGIFHLASEDLVHHDELFREITSKMGDKTPIFKNVFSSNDTVYSAILAKHKNLPKQYQISVAEVVEESSLNEDIVSIR